MEARYYIRLEDHKVKCILCPHQCIINEGKKGICKIRNNTNGILHTLDAGIFSAVNFDPIEKKPLYHFYPGNEILSLGLLGCNFHCACCQNYEIAQSDPTTFPRTIKLSTQQIIELSDSHPGNIGIAYTYNEPSVWFEHMIDIAKKSKLHGLKNVVVSNGYINTDPLKELIEITDAFNIDIKCFDETTHKKFTGGELKTILDNLIQIVYFKKHLELTSLIVPGLNESKIEFKNLVNWISVNLGKDVPLHISRYFPRYKMTKKPTIPGLILEFAAIASKILNFVYVGNISDNNFQETRCPQCNQIVAVRDGYSIPVRNFGKNGECLFCGNKIMFA